MIKLFSHKFTLMKSINYRYEMWFSWFHLSGWIPARKWACSLFVMTLLLVTSSLWIPQKSPWSPTPIVPDWLWVNQAEVTMNGDKLFVISWMCSCNCCANRGSRWWGSKVMKWSLCCVRWSRNGNSYVSYAEPGPSITLRNSKDWPFGVIKVWIDEFLGIRKVLFYSEWFTRVLMLLWRYSRWSWCFMAYHKHIFDVENWNTFDMSN